MIGIACIHSYQLVTVVESFQQAGQRGFAFMRDALGKGRQYAETLGYIYYPVLDFARLAEPVAVPAAGCSTFWLQGILQRTVFRRQGHTCTLAHVLVGWQQALGLDLQKCRVIVDVVDLWGHLAFAIASGVWTCLGVAAIHKRTRVARLLARNPSSSVLKKFKDLHGPAAAADNTVPFTLRRSWPFKLMPPPASRVCPIATMPMQIIRFMKASSYYKDLKKVPKGMKASVEALFPEEAELLWQRAQKTPARTLLIKGRVRLHCAAMIIRRAEWESLVMSKPQPQVSFAIGCDASPQIGLEIFGTILYQVLSGDVDTTVRRHLPLSCLGRGHTQLIDKLMAVCWSVFLEFGPKLHTMRAFFNNVRVMVSDMGTEMGICDAPDILPIFWEWLKTGQKGDMRPQPGSFLFPRAMYIPGWNHLWHNIAKDVCMSLPWYPLFLSHLKALVRFLRVREVRIALSKLPALTQGHVTCLDNFMASFAAWRWATLHLACKGISSLQFLRERWEAAKAVLYSGESRDKAQRKAVDEAMCSDLFWVQLRGMTSLMSKIDGFRTWGSACACHEQDLKEGKTVSCVRKGCLLVYVNISAFMVMQPGSLGPTKAHKWAHLLFIDELQLLIAVVRDMKGICLPTVPGSGAGGGGMAPIPECW